VDKKRPRFPGGSWQEARVIAASSGRLWQAISEGYHDVALVCGPVAALDFDARDGETEEDVRERAREAVQKRPNVRRVVLKRSSETEGDLMTTARILRHPEVIRITGLSRTTLWRSRVGSRWDQIRWAGSAPRSPTGLSNAVSSATRPTGPGPAGER
jgi:hypothetical protein